MESKQLSASREVPTAKTHALVAAEVEVSRSLPSVSEAAGAVIEKSLKNTRPTTTTLPSTTSAPAGAAAVLTSPRRKAEPLSTRIVASVASCVAEPVWKAALDVASRSCRG